MAITGKEKGGVDQEQTVNTLSCNLSLLAELVSCCSKADKVTMDIVYEGDVKKYHLLNWATLIFR